MESDEITGEMIAAALREVLNEEEFSCIEYVRMCSQDLGDALGDAHGILHANGIDPDGFLREKGIQE